MTKCCPTRAAPRRRSGAASIEARCTASPSASRTSTRAGRTTCGSKTLQHYVADEDCVAVSRLKEAGALILGKTATYEFAYGIQSLKSPVPPGAQRLGPEP